MTHVIIHRVICSSTVFAVIFLTPQPDLSAGWAKNAWGFLTPKKGSRAMKTRTATAKWQGSLKEGKGEISTESAVLKKTPYSFKMRFEDAPGTNPEELIAAALASCYAMSLSGELQKINYVADSIKVQAHVMADKSLQNRWEILQIHLDVEAVVLGCLPQQFETAANMAKTNCPVAQLLKVDISLEARLLTLPIEMFF